MNRIIELLVVHSGFSGLGFFSDDFCWKEKVLNANLLFFF